MEIKTNDVTPKLDGDGMYDKYKKKKKLQKIMMNVQVLQPKNVIQRATVLFAINAGEKRRALPKPHNQSLFFQSVSGVVS